MTAAEAQNVPFECWAYGYVRAMKNFLKERIFVILSRPSSPENIGLVARGMKNTGFGQLRLVLDQPLSKDAFKTAVHSEGLLKNAGVYSSLQEATQDMNVVFAAASRRRRNFPSLTLHDAVEKMMRYSEKANIGLVFGNERTGLITKEMRCSNFRFSLPQATKQPSYNLASAVLLTLFQLFMRESSQEKTKGLSYPVSRKEQEECIQLIIRILTDKKFIHSGNREHIIDRMYDLLGRLEMTQKDRSLLLAVFAKGVEDKR